jgi:hypothetical protein
MSIRSNGSYIGPRPAGPSSEVASGIWDLRTAERQKRASAWPVVGADPDFSSVALLLHMDGSGSTFVDSSGTPKTITAVGNATQSTAQSKFGGKSALFDGNGDYLTVGSFPTIGTSDFVIEFWLRPETVSGLQILIDFRPANGAYPVLYSDGTSLVYYVDSFPRITGSITNQVWQHIAIARSSLNTRLYIDGTQAGSTYSDSTSYAASTPTICRSFDDFFFYGYMDDLRITVGASRGYTGASITVPTAAFPDA